MKKLLPIVISLAFGSLSQSAFADDLAQIYQQAKQNDPQLLKAAADKDAAFEAINSSRSTLLPQINLTAGYNTFHLDAKNKQDGFNAGVALTQEIYNRSSWINLDISEKEARQSDAAYAVQQQGLILRVSEAYFNVLKAKDDLKFVEAEKAAVGRQLEQVKQRFEVGLSAITDVHDAQAQYDSVLANVIIKENEVANSYEALREITGQDYTSIDTLNTKTFAASKLPQSADSLVKTAQTENLTLLASRIGQDVARDKISLADSGHLPTLSFESGYSYDKTAMPAVDEGTLTAGIKMNLPVYTGGNTTSQVKQAQYSYVAASEELEGQYRTVVKNVRNYYNNINAQIGAIHAYQQSVISAKSALEATEAGFDVGTRTIVDVLDSTRRLYQANSQLANARYDYILAQLQLKQAVGTLSEQDIVDINKGLVQN
ncbi:outer membrane channel protein TolC [Photobacterium leiognathi]|uniref:outer membrane channel protein TolC n=1 Tax=Photobacterium leiognathi TaxID=553611 RepID=UPI0002088CCF|nr:outer membrane channel protein TolC [Photobacterium leiognathi]PSU94176.1 outer membrane channel protein TolC [Photobacterium leiognathi subsp. mandapamensis]PSW42330.1 outer membrane channel protein TolC [Photobacterium leiognathi subsp. mandapamensis]PSW51893.1 outer membrane channel protein TolC [Photobacterium leiognathi subsp. mandapamensis]PSW63904.1 outer membrane channel protein TolC [Photobacterium leiognathi subsp. mandapamensis]GAA06902.1 tolC outer membrane channel [Photobacteri